MNSSPLKQLFFVLLGLFATAILLFELTRTPKETTKSSTNPPPSPSSKQELYTLQGELRFSEEPESVELMSAKESKNWQSPLPNRLSNPLSFSFLAPKQQKEGRSYLELELFCQWADSATTTSSPTSAALPSSLSPRKVTATFSCPAFSAPQSFNFSSEEEALIQTLILPLPSDS